MASLFFLSQTCYEMESFRPLRVIRFFMVLYLKNVTYDVLMPTRGICWCKYHLKKIRFDILPKFCENHPLNKVAKCFCPLSSPANLWWRGQLMLRSPLHPSEVKLTCTTVLSAVTMPQGTIMESGHVRAAKLSSRGASKVSFSMSTWLCSFCSFTKYSPRI